MDVQEGYYCSGKKKRGGHGGAKFMHRSYHRGGRNRGGNVRRLRGRPRESCLTEGNSVFYRDRKRTEKQGTSKREIRKTKGRGKKGEG